MWKNDRLDKVRSDLLDQNIIEIGGEINGDTSLYVREAILRLMGRGSPPIRIFITSGGGSVTCGLDIYDTLSYYRGEKTGIVQGFAKSMAAVVLQTCQKRQSMRHASLLIHHVSTSEVKLDELRSKKMMDKVRKGAEADQARLYQILSSRTSHNLRKIRQACAKNQSMKAEEALAFRLIDEII